MHRGISAVVLTATFQSTSNWVKNASISAAPHLMRMPFIVEQNEAFDP